MDKNQYLSSMKADSIPCGSSGLWFIYKTEVPSEMPNIRHGKPVIVSAGNYTFLCRITDETLYKNPPGEVVMEDTPFELKTHLGFVMSAYGKVLVTGLGLGCVVRGLLENPKVEHVTCIENSPDVLKLVSKFMPSEKLEIIEADALRWTAQNEKEFDCAWHDLWTNRSEGEPRLDIWHARLFGNLRNTVRHQGAWMFDRRVKRVLLNKGFDWIG